VTAVSLDRRFVAAYHAALSLATAVLAAGGYRAGGEAHHATVFKTLPLVISETEHLARYYDTCRRKRNRALYDRVGQVSDDEVAELINSVREFATEVKRWLQEHHPELYPGPTQ